jgi:hypothetical protein
MGDVVVVVIAASVFGVSWLLVLGLERLAELRRRR